MATIPQQKRIWRPWYALPEVPLCSDCNIPCIVKRTKTTEDGKKIQHRYCPKCNKSFKTTYRIEED